MGKYIDFGLSNYIQDGARRAAARFTAVDLEDYWQRLAVVDREDIWQKLSDQPEIRWSGAVPVYEPAGYHQATNTDAKGLIGVDGSQINSDPEMVFLWGYVQAVAVNMHGDNLFRSDFLDIDSLLAGEIDRPDVDWLLYPNLTSLTTFTDLWRTLIELDVCVESAQNHRDQLVIWDNPLLPLGAGVRTGLLRKVYGDRLSKLQGCSLAGLVSGPKSHLLANLITLSEVPGMDQALKIRSQVSDSDLMRFGLPIGQRSAVFRYGSPFESKPDPRFPDIYFFFIRINEFEIVRVEVPEWIGKDSLWVDAVHATILSDSIALGYSLALLSAHHSVTIAQEIGRELNLKAWSAYTQYGGQFFVPAKVRAKRG